jgi:hypothetical protein
MALNNPPPYFPQNSLSPPDPKRYRRFKMLVAAAIVALLLFVCGVGIGIYYIIRFAF